MKHTYLQSYEEQEEQHLIKRVEEELTGYLHGSDEFLEQYADVEYIKKCMGSSYIVVEGRKVVFASVKNTKDTRKIIWNFTDYKVVPKIPKIYVDMENKVLVAKNIYGDLVFKHIDRNGVVPLDFDDRMIVDIYDLTDEEARYNKKILELLEE